MIIGVDGNEANVKERVGVSVYTLKLLEYFKRSSDKNTQFIIYLRENPKKDLPAENRYFKYKIIKGTHFWIQFFLPLHLFFNRDINVYFAPAHYTPSFCPVPIVVTIHDLAYYYYPNEFLKKDLYKLQNWTKASVTKAKQIIAVSKTTKKDLHKFYKLNDDKVRVIYNGYEKKQSLPTLKNKAELSITNKPFLLYVGTLQPRKNVLTLIKAFDVVKKIIPDLELIIAGKKGWLFDEIFKLVEEMGLEDCVYFTGFVTDQQLAYLYQNACCFILPSLYEGFGLPILEAMSFGCPVISSFTASLPEIGADACMYFDPNNVDDLVEKIQQLLNNQQQRSELIQKGKLRIREFSWNRCGAQTLETIKNAYQNNPQ